MAELVLTNATLPDGRLVALSIAGGVISQVGEPRDADEGSQAIDLGGALVVPGFVEGHIHLDKCFIGDRWHPYRPGHSIQDRIRIEREELAKAKSVDERARSLLERCIANGTSYIRTHIDVDPQVGLDHIEAVLGVRDEYRDAVQIEIVAFPQHGLLVNPGTLDLMNAALDAGADLVGGLDPASFDRDVPGHLDAIFSLAERRGVGIDIHLHDGGESGAQQLEAIAERTRALSLEGRVAVSHAFALGQIDDRRLEEVADRLAIASVSIMTNAPGDHTFPPVLALRKAGVNVFGGSDNVRDSWWPYGNADMLDRAMMIGYRSGFYTDDELNVAFDLVSHAGAKAVGLDRYGLNPGDLANLVAIEADHIPEAVVAHPPRKLVLHDGRIVAKEGAFCRS